MLAMVVMNSEDALSQRIDNAASRVEVYRHIDSVRGEMEKHYATQAWVMAFAWNHVKWIIGISVLLLGSGAGGAMVLITIFPHLFGIPASSP